MNNLLVVVVVVLGILMNCVNGGNNKASRVGVGRELVSDGTKVSISAGSPTSDIVWKLLVVSKKNQEGKWRWAEVIVEGSNGDGERKGQVGKVGVGATWSVFVGNAPIHHGPESLPTKASEMNSLIGVRDENDSMRYVVGMGSHREDEEIWIGFAPRGKDSPSSVTVSVVMGTNTALAKGNSSKSRISLSSGMRKSIAVPMHQENHPLAWSFACLDLDSSVSAVEVQAALPPPAAEWFRLPSMSLSISVPGGLSANAPTAAVWAPRAAVHDSGLTTWSGYTSMTVSDSWNVAVTTPGATNPKINSGGFLGTVDTYLQNIYGGGRKSRFPGLIGAVMDGLVPDLSLVSGGLLGDVKDRDDDNIVITSPPIQDNSICIGLLRGDSGDVHRRDSVTVHLTGKGVSKEMDLIVNLTAFLLEEMAYKLAVGTVLLLMLLGSYMLHGRMSGGSPGAGAHGGNPLINPYPLSAARREHAYQRQMYSLMRSMLEAQDSDGDTSENDGDEETGEERLETGSDTHGSGSGSDADGNETRNGNGEGQSLPSPSKNRESSEDRPIETISLGECIVCCERGADTVIVPCGHTMLCFKCAKRVALQQMPPICPTCRGPMSFVQRIYA